jgi:hypothetical protein
MDACAYVHYALGTGTTVDDTVDTTMLWIQQDRFKYKLQPYFCIFSVHFVHIFTFFVETFYNKLECSPRFNFS